MKFPDIEYKRPDINETGNEINSLLADFKAASDGKVQYEILKKINKLRKNFSTMRTLASIRYTINTEDEFYIKEHEYFDNISPLYASYINNLYKTLASTKHRAQLEKFTGSELFNIAETTLKIFSDEVIDDLKTENALVTKYVKLIASAKINFEGEERNLAGISPFMQSENREIRKRAAEAKWSFFEENEKEFDTIYDDLVRIRTQIARKLGYKNFIQLGYDRMGRNCYTFKEVENFRNEVKEFIVPIAQSFREMQIRRTELNDIYYYDKEYFFKTGNPTPKGSPEWIVEKAKKMYEVLSPETSDFIKLMIDRSMMDLYNRKGKSAGGYCSYIPNYDSPFIFANMNGTSHDIRVLTHEAGHAFQAYESRNFEMIEYVHPTLEACEIHSMSMEFITWPWMQLFFEDDTDKFLFCHLSEALSFIPYGVTVDEFQHFVYENPEASPDERKKMWRNIEKKYTPQKNYEDNNFLNRGGYWFQQGHIFKKPFYYIDYCLAQICALQFWKKCNQDRNDAWKDYLNLCKAGGSKNFLELLKIAKLESPFDKNVVKSIAEYSDDWVKNASMEFDFSKAS